jgi:sodium/potassium-transporting ATPase subunit alpha
VTKWAQTAVLFVLNYCISTELASLDHHTVTVDEIFQRFSTNEKLGLDTEQAKRRLQANGPNSPTPPPRNLLKK